jgi:N-acetylglucosamine-6-sulfatase
MLTAGEVDELTRLHRSRLESLLSVDALAADLTSALRHSDELQDTLFIYTSDNGYLLGEHRLSAKEALYEEVIRVPLILRGPGLPEGVTRHQPVANIDLAPTILDLAGIRPPHKLDGMSLLPIARNPQAEAERAILVEFLTKREFYAVRTRDFVYAEHEHGAMELYDLERDPHQLHSLARNRSYADVRLRLARLLDRLRKCSGASCHIAGS